jgi:hypothetical protein
MSGATTRAELIGSTICAAIGITVRAYAPILEMCRRLIAAGFDPAFRLEAYRGGVLCLTVRSIGEGARLRPASHGGGLEPLPKCTGASPMRRNAEVAP